MQRSSTAPLLALSLIALLALAAEGCGRAPRPNLLLITVDALRADHTSLYGYARDTTPRIAARFSRGVVYDRAYSTEANTSPSVVSILTGLQPQHHHVRLLYQKVPEDLATLPRLLEAAGYRTSAVVSNVVLTDEAIGLASHFDHYDDAVDRALPGWSAFERVAAHTTDAARDWLAEAAGGSSPVFLWVHYIDPHGPYRPPADAPQHFTHQGRRPIDPRRVRRLRLQQAGSDDGLEWQDRYDDEIAYADREIGRLLDAWDALGFGRRDVLVFTADHGETMMEHERWFTHGYNVYEPIVRVPLAIVAPGLGPARVSQPVSLVDVAPTLLDLAGVPVPPDLDGRSLEHGPPAQPIFAEATSSLHSQWRAAILGNEKWVAERRRDGRRGPRYRVAVDQEGDPGARKPWKGGAGAAALEAWMAADPDPGGVPREYDQGRLIRAPKVAPGVSPEALEKLRALGYVE